MLGTVYESNPAINDGLETNHSYSNIPTMGHDSFPSCTPTFSSLNRWWRMLPSGSCSSATKILRKLTAWQIEALHLRFLCCNECKSGKKLQNFPILSHPFPSFPCVQDPTCLGRKPVSSTGLILDPSHGDVDFERLSLKISAAKICQNMPRVMHRVSIAQESSGYLKLGDNIFLSSSNKKLSSFGTSCRRFD